MNTNVIESHEIGESIKKILHLARSYCAKKTYVMISVLASSVLDCGVRQRSGQIKDYKIGNCSFSAKHPAL